MRQCLLVFLILLGGGGLYASKTSQTPVVWPDGIKTAVSLSYDDALASQLDHAVPSLDKHQFKASFYLTLSSPVIAKRLDQWRALAVNGHELGNHALYHPCSGSLPKRHWVKPFNDLDTQTPQQMKQEITTANSFLQALDGKTERTITLPCGEFLAGGKDYRPLIEPYFIAIKGYDVLGDHSTLWAPSNVSGDTLIEFVKKGAASGTMVNLLFHGIGADHMTVSKQAHDQLLQYLADNREIYWVDTYINIMKYVNAQLLP